MKKAIHSAVLCFSLLVSCPIYATVAYEVDIAKGIKLMSEGGFKDALILFQNALAASPGNTEALYYSAMAYSRLGEFDKAEGAFRGILDKDKDFVDAYLELGRIYYITGKCDDAESALKKYVSRADDAGLSKYASDMMQACRAEEDEGGMKRDYYLNISLGSQYDDNVIVEPSNPATPSDRKSDQRALVYLTAGKSLFERGVVSMKGDYSFYLSQHLHMSGLNVNSQSLGPTIEFGFSEALRPSLGYSLVYTSVGGDLYSLSHEYSAKVRVIVDEKSFTDILYEYTALKYWDSSLFQTASIRDGYKQSAGISQNYTGNFKAGLYLYFDTEDTNADYWSYEGFRLGGEISSEILPSLYGKLSAEYSEKEYGSLLPDAAEIRVDEAQKYSASLTYVINKTLSLQLTESYTVNDSNLELYNYRRNIMGLFLTAGVL
ncbi:MAG: tetratricopeptide repeat protein [Nitrospirae bacterium]|nr:tetratricopeptide repeat protein [Nitrospirota bacterium]